MYYSSNEIYAGFIRSVGGWDRFKNILDNQLLLANNNEEKLLIFKKNFIRVDDSYVIDEFISHSKKEVEQYTVSRFEEGLKEMLAVEKVNTMNIYKDFFILGIIMDYEQDKSIFDSAKNKEEDLDPLLEGITHINVYTKSKFTIGKGLSNLANIGFNIDDQHFQSLEGFWYWNITGKQYESFKNMTGFEAKKKGLVLCEEGRSVTNSDDPVFQEEIKRAIRTKIKQNPELLTELIKSTLPLKHYYYHQGTKNILSFKITDKSKYQWQLDEMERIRELCQKKMHEVGQLSSYPPLENELAKITKPRFK
ncbi:hypothetical protein ACTOJ1_000959 [Shigella flexneri]